MKINKRKIEKIFAILLAIVLLVAIYLNTYLLIKYNVLPIKYLIVYFIVVGLIPILMMFFSIFRRPKLGIRIVLYFFQVLYLVILFIVFGYLNNTFDFLNDFTSKYVYETKNYYVLVNKDASYKNIEEIEGKSMGYAKGFDSTIDEALKKLSKKVTVTNSEYEGYNELFADLDNSTIDSVLITDTFYEMLNEEENPITINSKILYKFSIKEKIEEIAKEVDVTKEPFTIYISGMDSYGSVTAKTRSDVNILMTINPKTYEVLMVTIPRDYYVTLHSINQKDKLTHAGIYGIDNSVKTIEDLLDIKINYYIKVNYSAVINLVDALKGVSVYSEYDFYSAELKHHFVKGYNDVNGKEALDFVRTRKAFLEGDRVRGENQQRMIQAIINKASSPAILLQYDEILKALEGSFATNISTESITELINFELDKMPKWNITSISLNGSDGHEITPNSGGIELYVMYPDEETVENAKEKISEVLK